MKVKYFGYVEVAQKWFPLMHGDGLEAIIDDDEDPLDYLEGVLKMASIENYIATYIVLEK